MSNEQILAMSVGTTQPRSVTFEVSDIFLDEPRLAEWSEPVQFKFERRGDGYDLVMRTADES